MDPPVRLQVARAGAAAAGMAALLLLASLTTRDGTAAVTMAGSGSDGPMDSNPVKELSRTAHTVIVRDLSAAEAGIEMDHKVAVPCSFGVACHLHVRPTLIERTDGAWLHEGSDYGGSGSAPAEPPRQAHRSRHVEAGAAAGPWMSSTGGVVNNLAGGRRIGANVHPHSIEAANGGGEGQRGDGAEARREDDADTSGAQRDDADVDGSGDEGGEARDRSDETGLQKASDAAEQEVTDAKIAVLKAAEARIKARVGKVLGMFSEASDGV